jgi:hypothetical protein
MPASGKHTPKLSGILRGFRRNGFPWHRPVLAGAPNLMRGRAGPGGACLMTSQSLLFW